MKRTLAVLALSPFAALTLGAGPAQAAEGVLLIDDTEYRDPVGCYDTDRWPLVVHNRTNVPVYVFSDSGCTGHYLTTVEQGERVTSERGQSVYVE